MLSRGNFSFIIVVALFLAGFFAVKNFSPKPVNNTPVQYQLATDNTYEKVPATPSAKPQNNSPDDFARWSILENFAGGYRLVYPAGFKINYEIANKIEVSPPTGGGKVTVTITVRSFSVAVDASGANAPQIQLLAATKRLIENSFEFIGGPGYDPAAAKKRFGQ